MSAEKKVEILTKVKLVTNSTQAKKFDQSLLGMPHINITLLLIQNLYFSAKMVSKNTYFYFWVII
jgi:hypothetical protein